MPTPNMLVRGLTCLLEKWANGGDIKKIAKWEFEGPTNVTFDYLEEQIVYDFNSDTHSSTFDAEADSDPSDHLVELIFKWLCCGNSLIDLLVHTALKV